MCNEHNGARLVPSFAPDPAAHGLILELIFLDDYGEGIDWMASSDGLSSLRFGIFVNLPNGVRPISIA
jgi:hypothetical protein